MIKKNLAHDMLSRVLVDGVRFAEIFAEQNVKNTVTVVNGRVEGASSGTVYGLGLRLITHIGVLYSYTNDLSRGHLLKLAEQSADAVMASNRQAVPYAMAARFHDETLANRHRIQIAPAQIQKKLIADLLRGASDAAFDYDPLITQTKIHYMDSDQHVWVANSEGLWKEDRRTRSRVSVGAVASSETEKQSAHMAPGAMMGYEFYRTVDINALAREAARSAVTMLGADYCAGGKFPVIIDNGFGGVIFHEACGHALEAAHIVKDASVFAGKMHTQIASRLVTAIDDGTIPNSWGSLNMDDEGANAQKTVLIENGILRSYLVDKYSGMKLGLPVTASGRRESYRFPPTSRMTNTFIANGTDTKETITADTEYGIYAKYMGGGSVNTATGEFNFAVNEAYMVRNGKIAEPVRGATLIGKGADVLMRVDKVASNLARAEGMCGAASGQIPVTVGQPTIRVAELIVGGRS